MIKFIKHFWFHIFITFLLLCFVGIAVLILLSPKQDMKRRGFVPCTEEMIEDLLNCNRRFLCSSRAIIENNLCVAQVIRIGFSDWVKGKQPRPWSNYIFKPELYSDSFIDQEEVKKYLETHPDVKIEMERLHRMRKDMENENNKQIDSEKKWNEEK